MKAALAALAALWAGPGLAADCLTERFEGASYTSCRIEAAEDLRLFWGDAEGVAHGGFQRLEAALRRQGLRLAMAMNAGMFGPDLAPVGLYVEEGRKAQELVTRDGPGNFGLLPNGVFCIGQQPRYRVIETRRFARERPDCRHATQSGPMLVIDGKLHPRFLADSPSVHFRNGVGVRADGAVAWLVISDDRVNFHAFARYFRDHLKVRDALYLDGSISRLHAPQLERSDFGFPIGPMLGVVEEVR